MLKTASGGDGITSGRPMRNDVRSNSQNSTQQNNLDVKHTKQKSPPSELDRIFQAELRESERKLIKNQDLIKNKSSNDVRKKGSLKNAAADGFSHNNISE